MGAIKGYTTTISVAKTTVEIQTMLSRRGVTRMSTMFDDDAVPSGLAFEMKTDFGLREFALPVRIDGVLDILTEAPGLSRAQRTREHAAKVAWRIARDWLDAQMALVDAALAPLDEVLFPFMLSRDGQTAYAVYRGGQKEISPRGERAVPTY